jgi:NitT/TauT family transport system substrate-binding protein
MKKIAYLLVFTVVIAGSAFGVWKMFQYSHKDEIRISTNPWIGFTPFIYAQEKGWLEETPFKFVWLVDLSENSRLFEKGFSEGFTATQYELMHFEDKEDLTTIFLIDRSYGADAILSNRTLEALHQTNEKINVYLEMGSFNESMFNAFMAENDFNKEKFVFFDISQKNMEAMAQSDKPIVMVTYEPYLSKVKASGLSVIASTRTLKTFYAVDALFARRSSYEDNPEAYRELKHIFKRALAQMRKDPKEFYTTISGYQEGGSYEDFLASSQQIQWLEDDIPPLIMETLKQQNIPTDKLLL